MKTSGFDWQRKVLATSVQFMVLKDWLDVDKLPTPQFKLDHWDTFLLNCKIRLQRSWSISDDVSEFE